ncbi:MAG: hypothetical protein QNJ64_10145 [Crocosphaera sp.]|nr:hypothetical protein [Crocosphaera sp.]
MNSWEFLIQKDDDIKWYPASSSTLELEPGKYRILGKSNLSNTKIDVKVSSSEQEIECYQRSLNSQGLVMILPFTEFSSGTSYKIRCQGDILSDFLGEPWTQTISLNILPVTSQSQQNRANINLNKVRDYLAQLKQKLKSKPKLSKNRQKSRNFPLFNLSLEEDNLVINGGNKLEISGSIKPVEIQGDVALNAQLHYELIDPETMENLLMVDCALSETKLPHNFHHTLVIPDTIQHNFILGKLILETSNGFPLTHCSFSITNRQYYSINCSIELLDVETENSYIFDLELSEKIKNQSTPLALPNTHQYSRLFPSHFCKPRQILPPKLDYNFVTEKHKNLKLPQIN